MKTLISTTCPLCHKEVQSWVNSSETDFQDLTCETRVNIGKTDISHFTRLLYYYRNSLNSDAQYQLTVPPFQLSWTDSNKMLVIYRWIGLDRQYWKVVEPVEFDEVVHWAKRLQNLTVFS